MRYTLALLFLTFGITIFAQPEPIEVAAFQSAPGTVIFQATNHTYAPYTVVLKINGKNVKLAKDAEQTVLIPPNTSEFELNTLTFSANKKSGYGFEYSYTLGDTENSKHNNRYKYTLPFEPGTSFVVGQGYYGPFSHTGKKAVDFDMPEGTTVCAAREGTIIKVKEDSDRGCKSESCKKLANLVTILHDDGTMADYVHLQLNGSAVEEGDEVKAGQVIGYSGSTGWASGPHLHFEVYEPRIGGRETVSTKFNTKEGTKSELEQGEYYTRE